MNGFDDAVRNHIREKVIPDVMKQLDQIVESEYNQLLKKYGLTIRRTAREIGNTKLSVVDFADIRKRVGEFVIKSTNGLHSYHFKPPIPLDPRDRIDTKRLRDELMANVMGRVSVLISNYNR